MAVQTTTFKGARYLVKFDGDWSQDKSYEAITSVKHNAFTYISKQPVPAGVEITNEDFWLLWADPNAQMAELNERFEENIEAIAAWGEQLDAETANREIADAKRIVRFETVDDMISSTDSTWENCIVLNGYTDRYCNYHKSIKYMRIKPDDPRHIFDGIYELANGDKVMPYEDFKDTNNDCIGNLAAISQLMCRKEYSYNEGYGVFTQPFNNGNKVGQCTTLCYMYQLGLNPYNSRYVNGENSTNKIPANAIFHKSTLPRGNDYQDYYSWAKYSAFEALTSGFGFVPEKITDLRIGDIIYTGTLDDSTVILNCGHCEVITSIDYESGTFVIWEWGGNESSVYRTGQGTANSPSMSIKDFEQIKSYIKMVARLPLNTLYKSRVIFDRKFTDYHVNLRPESGSSFVFGRILKNGFIGNDNGLLKITIEFNPVDNPIRFAVWSPLTDVINGSYTGISPISYGGAVTFFATQSEAEKVVIWAISQNRIETEITINHIKIEMINNETVFNGYIDNLFDNIAYPTQTEIIKNCKVFFTDEGMHVEYIVNGIDWAQVTAQTPIFKLAYKLTDFGDSSFTPNVYSRTANLKYNENYSWVATNVDELENKPLRISVILPLQSGSFMLN